MKTKIKQSQLREYIESIVKEEMNPNQLNLFKDFFNVVGPVLTNTTNSLKNTPNLKNNPNAFRNIIGLMQPILKLFQNSGKYSSIWNIVMPLAQPVLDSISNFQKPAQTTEEEQAKVGQFLIQFPNLVNQFAAGMSQKEHELSGQ